MSFLYIVVSANCTVYCINDKMYTMFVVLLFKCVKKNYLIQLLLLVHHAKCKNCNRLVV